MADDLKAKAYKIAHPAAPLPLIFDSPHSGTHYPKDFHYICAFEDLEQAEDKYVDDLFAAATDHGGTLLAATFPRSYIDPNRAEDDIDPNLIDGNWPYAIRPSARSDAGIGLIRRLVRPGVPVYDRALTAAQITRRIENYYRPYHDALQTLIDEAHYNFGQVWHINCHSMPSSSAHPRQPSGITLGNHGQPSDFVLGDRDGTSCAKDFTHMIRDHLKSFGYVVTINDPFKGVELVERHSNPARGRHSLQLEINKSLYLDEDSHEKSKNYAELKTHIAGLIKHCAAYVDSHLTQLAAD